MPVTLSYPGVYIEELPSGVRTITGVATSITAFIGRALRGPTNDPVRVQSFAEYERNFGGLWRNSTMSYAVQQFFQNGGTDALIVRVVNGIDSPPAKVATGAADTLNLVAANHGKWGNSLRVRVDHDTKDKNDLTPKLFNLTVRDSNTGVTERFLNLSVESNNARFVTLVLEQESNLIRVAPPGTVPATRPGTTPDAPPPPGGAVDPLPPGSWAFNPDGADGNEIKLEQISDPSLEATKKGIWALEKTDLFSLLCIPPFTFGGDLDSATRDAAAKYCEKRRAMYIVDPPSGWRTHSAVIPALNSFMTRSANAALYFPYVRIPDPLQENRLADFAPCGAVAGIIARTDAQRGVWKAPAGNDATLNGVVELTTKLTDGEHGQLNPLGVNCLRAFPVTGRVMWGARTLKGADQLADQWKYLPVRRLALFLEESLFRGTQWVVFEPNDEPLWAQIRLNLGAFMQNLFRQGAFQGRSPREAYFVKCDKETTTQNDIDLGIVNIVVGFAPLKPAEFVVIKLQQIAGQVQA
jgi:phage tail sheath protein FI